MRYINNLIIVCAHLILSLILLIEPHAEPIFPTLSILQVDALKLQPHSDGSSKTNRLSFSKFRENIIQVRQKQQQPVLQEQITSKVVSDEQHLIQQQRPAQAVHVTEQQQSLHDLSFVHNHEDSQQSSYTSANTESVYGSVQGTPGIDFPNYSSIPNTKFSCDGVPFEPGMYADESTGCQVYHLCYQGRRESFLCGIGTVFNQAILNCDFWHSVDCSKSSLHYGINADFGRSVSESGGDTNVQSFSQTSVSQTDQSIVGARNVQQQVIRNRQQSSVVVPAAPNLVLDGRTDFESRQQISGGKISPPRQSSFVSEMIDSSLAASQSINRGGASSGVLSPGRKAAQLNRVGQQITSAESSTVRSLTIQAAGTKSGKINTLTMNSNYKVNQGQLIDKKQSGSLADTNFNSKSSITKNSSSKTTKDQNLDQSEGLVWKPYFRNKGKIPSGMTAVQSEASSVPPAPVLQVTNTTPREPAISDSSATLDGDASTSARPDLPPSTVPQPNQEPTFSSIEISQPSTASEIPKIPNSKIPPPTESPASNAKEPSTETSVSIESDVSSALSTTTPKPGPDSDEDSTSTSAQPESDSNSGSPATSETPVPTTTTTLQTSGETSTQENVDSSRPATTTQIDQTTRSSSEVPDVTTTTTEPPVSESETPAQPATTTEASQESDESTQNQSESEKKKRGATVIGVEYVSRGEGKQSANSSSVVYAEKRASNAET